jgi:NADH:ubiquinone reductase (H+-translocating)
LILRKHVSHDRSIRLGREGSEGAKEMVHVVIVGGGFAGLGCAAKFASQPDVRVTLIDKNGYHQFQPLLYQVATAQLGPSNVAFMHRSVLKEQTNIDVKMAEVTSVDLKTCTAATSDGSIYHGDFLVLAAGSQPNFFNTPGADTNAFPLYSLQQAEMLRSRILGLFESADCDPALIKKGALNFIVVGGGPTGIEIAGAMADMIHDTMKSEYRDLPVEQAKILLIDHGKAVLESFTEKSQLYAAMMLQQRGVELRLGVSVKEVAPDCVLLSDGTKIPSRCVIWAGGLKASTLSGKVGIPLGHGGRIDVQPDLSVAGFPGVYALGDFANIAGADGKTLPQLAAVAEQCGKACTKNIIADIAGRPRDPFNYFDKGIMAMIGRNAAVAEIGPKHHQLQGVIAFAAWLGVHVALLSTSRAKIEVFVDWAWNYFGNVRGIQILDRGVETHINWNEPVNPPPLDPGASLQRGIQLTNLL